MEDRGCSLARDQEPDQGSRDGVRLDLQRDRLRKIMSRKFSIVLILLAGLFFFSCRMNGSDQPGAVEIDTIRTQAVSTFASSLPGTLAPKSTASTKPKSLPTF